MDRDAPEARGPEAVPLPYHGYCGAGATKTE